MAASYYNLLANIRDDQKSPPKGFGTTDYPRQATVTVTSAQILTSSTVPVTLISAPAEDYFIIIDEIAVMNDYGTATYAFAGDISIRYTDASGAKVVNDLPEVAFGEAAANAYVMRKAIDCIPVNGAVVMFAETDNPATGDGVFKFKIKYRIIGF